MWFVMCVCWCQEKKAFKLYTSLISGCGFIEEVAVSCSKIIMAARLGTNCLRSLDSQHYIVFNTTII